MFRNFISIALITTTLSCWGYSQPKDIPTLAPGQVFIAPQNDADYTEYIELSKKSGNTSLLNAFKGQSYSDNKVLALYNMFPTWALRPPQWDDIFLKNSLELYQNLSAIQRDQLNVGINCQILSAEQHDLLKRIFTEETLPGALPEHVVLARRQKLDDILNNEKATFRMSISPNIFAYDNGDYIGKISYECCNDQAANYGLLKMEEPKSKLKPDAGVLSWLQFPTQISPDAQVRLDIKEKEVNYGRAIQTMSVEEVVSSIDPSRKEVLVSKNLRSIKVAIAGENINSADVIRGLNIAIGSEARTVGKITYLSPSKTQLAVAEYAGYIFDAVYTREAAAQGFLAMLQNSLKLSGSIFPSEYFTEGQVHKFTDFSTEQKSALATVLPKDINLDTLELAFVPSVLASVYSPEHGTTLESFIATWPPNAPLRQPQGNSWNPFNHPVNHK